MSHAVLPHMTETKQGSIVNISSIWGVQGASCEAVYSSTKGGINSFTKALAKEMAPSNIRINGVAPGVIDTEMNSWMSKEDRESLEMEIPIGRFGKVQEIGEVVSYLCSDESSYLTGQIITVDGGFI
ncbi:3-oxoacyl-[acyl-carrier-protein] reductase FabG [compost metagenome]